MELDLNIDDMLLDVEGQRQPEHLAVYRLQTYHYKKGKSLCYEKRLTYVRKLSRGHDPLDEDFSYMGEINLINLDECTDGLYSINCCNFSHDYESGYIDGWDLQLVPYHISFDKDENNVIM